ncbi:MAG: hypothetical protein HN368_20330, partial [Spirochaetales bacterium]|nr:hypothetical protein [Spirochaetales bacterium]
MSRKQGLFTILVVLFATITAVSGFSQDVVVAAALNVDIVVSAVAAMTVSATDVSFTVGAVAPTAGEFPAIVATAPPTYLQYSS